MMTRDVSGLPRTAIRINVIAARCVSTAAGCCRAALLRDPQSPDRLRETAGFESSFVIACDRIS